jgi:proline iminopeptidase
MFKNFLLFVVLLGCASGTMFAGQKRLLASEQGFINVPGEQLYYQRFGKQAHETLIIVLHGGPGMDQSYLLPQMLELAKNQEVIFYDQRGSGKSSTHPLDACQINMKRFIEDLEAVRKYFGCDKIVLLGHSWGGLLAAEYALAYPQHIEALILLDSVPMTLNGIKVFDQQCADRLEGVKESLAQLQDSSDFQHGDPRAVEKFYSMIFQTYCAKKSDAKKITLHFSQATATNGLKIEKIFREKNFSKPYDLRSQLHQLTTPTLIIHGDQDPIPVATALETKGALPHSTLIVLKNCGHFSYLEQPKRCFREIRKFLSPNHE